MLNSQAGSVSLNNITGHQIITGVGFQPKVIIFFGNQLGADGSAANSVFSRGFTTSPTNRVAYSWIATDASNPTAATQRVDNTKCYTLIRANNTIIIDLDLFSFDTDGFTINITTSDGSSPLLNYVALGGDDLTGAKIVEFASKTSTGNQAITGVGFKPDSMMTLSSNLSTVPPATALALSSLGFASGITGRGAVGTRIGSAVAGAQVDEKTQRTNKVINSSNGGSVFLSADLASFDVDGFTLNWSTIQTTARYCHALLLKGGRFKTGSFNQISTLSNQSVTGLGFSPTGIILTSFNDVSSTSIVNDARFSFGAGTSSTSRATVWAGDQNGVTPQQSNSNIDRTKIIKMMTNADSPVVSAAADLVSMDSDGFTLNWSTVDSTAREVLYFAFGSGLSSVSPSPSATPSFSPSASASPSSTPSPSIPPVENILSIDLLQICFDLSFSKKYPDKCGNQAAILIPAVSSPSLSPSVTPSASVSPSSSISASPSPSSGLQDILLLEDGSRLLLETGDSIIL